MMSFRRASDDEVNDFENADGVEDEENHEPGRVAASGGAPKSQAFPNERPRDHDDEAEGEDAAEMREWPVHFGIVPRSQKKCYGNSMLIGIDYGKKRVGVAVSDSSERMAFPHAVWENWEALKKLLELHGSRGARAVIVGASRNLDGSDNPLMAEITAFGQKLEAKGLKVFFEPEFFSSLEAQRGLGDQKLEDASAAAIILQSYLDKNKND